MITAIRSSQLARPMVCAGFTSMVLPPQETNAAAEAGTACGEYLEKLLTNQPTSLVASNGVMIDEDMKFYVEPINEDIKSRAATPINCEHEIDWQTSSGIWIKGHPDITFIDHHGTLCIEDLKYGWGIVEVKENWQLLAYAIGEVIRLQRPFERISLKIHQPRPHHENGPTREWVLSYEELLQYKDRIETRMQEIANGRNDLQTSKQCKYCPAAGEACPAFNRLFYRALEVSTEFVQDSITDQELSVQLDQIKRAEEAIKIKKDSLTELGVQRIKQGKIIPNYVQQKKLGNRIWKSGITPDSIKMLTGKDVIEKTFMSPAKAEKAGVSKELVKQFCEAKFLGFKLEKADTTKIGNDIFGSAAPTGGK